MRKYKKISIPIAAYDNLYFKKQSMENTILNITGKKRRIPMTKVILAISKKPLFFENNEVINLSGSKKRR